jgi:hypothetical protein
MPTTDRKLRVFLWHASQDATSWHFANPPSANFRRQRLNAVPKGDDKGWIDPWLDEEKLLPPVPACLACTWRRHRWRSGQGGTLDCPGQAGAGKPGLSKELFILVVISNPKPGDHILVQNPYGAIAARNSYRPRIFPHVNESTAKTIFNREERKEREGNSKMLLEC